MPRHNPIDYPAVPHRLSVQPQLSLAPPPAFNDQDRYSWQTTPIEATSPGREDQLEVVNNTRRQQEQRDMQRRQSKIPPLPVLPGHLAPDRQEHRAQADLHVQRRDWTSMQYQQQYCIRFEEEQESGEKFPQRVVQDYQPSPMAIAEYGPTPSYEQSQCYQQPVKAAEQPALRNNDDSDPGVYGNANNFLNGQPIHPPAHSHQPDEQKIPMPAKIASPTAQVGSDRTGVASTLPIPDLTRTTQLTKQPMSVLTDMDFPPSHKLHQSQPLPSLTTTWHHSLGSCAEPTTCFSSLFCPCLIYGRTQYRLTLKSSGKDPTNMLGFTSFNGSCLAWSMLPGINVLLTAIQHRRIRKAYNMDNQAGNFIGDCAKGICCCCCILAQADKEVKIREMSATKHSTDGYKSPVNMRFVPQNRMNG